MSNPVAACIDLYGPFARFRDIAVSSDSEKVRERFRESREHFQESVTGQRLEPLLDELRDVFEECLEENWDGYGAPSVTLEACLDAARFIDLLSPSIPLPEIAPESSGEINLEWYKSKDHIFVVSFSGDNTVAYAGLFGSSGRIHGREHFVDSIPQVIIEQIWRLFFVCR
jgi:hypothetical protein